MLKYDKKKKEAFKSKMKGKASLSNKRSARLFFQIKS